MLWRDEQYYRNTETGQYMPKYVLILAISTDADDALGAVLTSKSNGLSEHPACDFDSPRAGYFGYARWPADAANVGGFQQYSGSGVLELQAAELHPVACARRMCGCMRPCFARFSGV